MIGTIRVGRTVSSFADTCAVFKSLGGGFFIVCKHIFLKNCDSQLFQRGWLMINWSLSSGPAAVPQISSNWVRFPKNRGQRWTRPGNKIQNAHVCVSMACQQKPKDCYRHTSNPSGSCLRTLPLFVLVIWAHNCASIVTLRVFSCFCDNSVVLDRYGPGQLEHHATTKGLASWPSK